MEKKKLEKIIGMLEPNEFSIDQRTIQNYCTDWRGIYKGKSDLIIFPQNVIKISKVLKFCQKNKISI